MNIFWMILFVASSLATSSAYARVCTLDEIKDIDTAYMGERLSVFPVMNTVATYSPIVAYIPKAHEADESSFWTVSFVGVLGAIYFRIKNLSIIDCEDQEGRRRYSPTSGELLSFHQAQRGLFWETYTWNAIWMAGLIATTGHNDKRAAAVVAMILPWSFAFSRNWSAWAEDSELQFAIYPDQKGSTLGHIKFSF